MTAAVMAGRLARGVAGVVAVLAAAALIGAMFILAAGKDPMRAYGVLLVYTLGSANGFYESIVRTIPLTLAGLGIAVAFRANVFNIGADGQAIVGAIAAVALFVQPVAPGGALAIVVFLLVGLAAGAVYGGLAGWLRARYNANEIIVTIMLNYIALQLLAWAIRGPVQERMRIMPRSDAIPRAAQLDLLISGSRVHEGLIVAAIATVVVFALMRYASFGYQLRAVGINPFAARYGGISDRAVIFLALAVSGGLAGLAGAVEIAGIHHRLQDNFAPGLGNGAIAAALLARLNAAAVPFTAFLFGVLHAGSGALQREAGIPFPIVWIVEGIVILAFLVLGWLRTRRVAVA
jgi:simple sugar transport system permease protein